MTELPAAKPSLIELFSVADTLEYGASKMNFAVLRKWLAGYDNRFGHFFDSTFLYDDDDSARQEKYVIFDDLKVLVQRSKSSDKILTLISELHQKSQENRSSGLSSLETYFENIGKAISKQRELLIQILVASVGKTYREASVEVDRTVKLWQCVLGDQEATLSVNSEVKWITGQYRSPLLQVSLFMRQQLARGNFVVLTGFTRQYPLLVCLTSLCAEAKLPGMGVNVVATLYSTAASIIECVGPTQTSSQRPAVDCFVVYDSGDLDAALEALVSYIKLSNSILEMSACLLVQASVWEEFVQLLKERLRKVSVGDLHDRNTDIRSFGDRDYTMEADLNASLGETGIQVLWPGNVQYTAPKVVIGAGPANELLKFDRRLSVVVAYPFRTHKESLTLINSLPSIETASVFSENLSLAMSVAPQIKAKSVCINGYGFTYEAMDLTEEITCDLAPYAYKMNSIKATSLTKDQFKLIDGLKTAQKAWSSKDNLSRAKIFRDIIPELEQKLNTKTGAGNEVKGLTELLKPYQQEGKVLKSGLFEGTILQTWQPRGVLLVVLSSTENVFATVLHTLAQGLVAGNSLLIIPVDEAVSNIVAELLVLFSKAKLPTGLVRVLNVAPESVEQTVLNLLILGDVNAFISLGYEYKLINPPLNLADGNLDGSFWNVTPGYVQTRNDGFTSAATLEKTVGFFKNTFIPSGDSFGN